MPEVWALRAAGLDHGEEVGRVDRVGESVPGGDGNLALLLDLGTSQINGVGQWANPVVNLKGLSYGSPGQRHVAKPNGPDRFLGKGLGRRFH